ncbi:MAG: aminoglycoside 6'-N-acetyltransferase [Clostridiaceae bacterium]
MLRKAAVSDSSALAQLAILLWPNHAFEDLKQEIEALLSNPNAAFFLYFDRDIPAGFAQCQLRHDYVEGTNSSPVGYLEGVFVIESHRKQGIATRLLENCEQWARENGCVEFASDCEITNMNSYAFHVKFGFQEANRIICFCKKLTPSND